jgi:hypothetical protein
MSGLPTGERALDQFLFESKEGNCEFFASSFALILRAAGVPARLVGGYLGGEYNQLGGYYLVSEGMAHVWVEVYLDGQGWLRVDPSRFARNAASVWASPRRSLLLRLRMALDSVDHTWNRAVITYDFERQADVARKLGSSLLMVDAGRALKAALPYLGVVFVLAGICISVSNRKRLFLTREERMLRTFYRRVELDCSLRPERGRVGLFEIAGLTASSKVRAFADIYSGAVYRDRRLTDDEYIRLKQIVSDGFRNDAA